MVKVINQVIAFLLSWPHIGTFRAAWRLGLYCQIIRFRLSLGSWRMSWTKGSLMHQGARFPCPRPQSESRWLKWRHSAPLSLLGTLSLCPTCYALSALIGKASRSRYRSIRDWHFAGWLCRLSWQFPSGSNECLPCSAWHLHRIDFSSSWTWLRPQAYSPFHRKSWFPSSWSC